MHKIINLCAMALMLAGCASAPREAFDPSDDPRIGAEVARACSAAAGGSSGGYRSIGGRDAFLTGSTRQKYLLVFSSGCGSLGSAGAIPVFHNYGGSCRYRGERVEVAESSFGVMGACTIQHIYEWDEQAADEEEAEDESDA